jgi:hypothetical protein
MESVWSLRLLPEEGVEILGPLHAPAGLWDLVKAVP